MGISFLFRIVPPLVASAALVLSGSVGCSDVEGTDEGRLDMELHGTEGGAVAETSEAIQYLPLRGPQAIARKPDLLDLFIVGKDGRVYTSFWTPTGGWSGASNNWLAIGGFFPSRASLSALARQPDVIDLFITGNDGRVYTSFWTPASGWTGVNNNWLPIGGFFPPGAPVTTLARQPDVIDLFITGNDGRVYNSFWTPTTGWSGVNNNWRKLGGFFPPNAPVSALARQPDVIDLFITGNDGRVYTSSWTPAGGWSGVNNNWVPIGGFFPRGAAVSALARQPDVIDLFITGNDGRVYTSYWTPTSGWSGVNNNWVPIGGFFPRGAQVSALARQPGRLDLFITGNDGRVYTSFWTPTSGWSGVNNNWQPIGGFFPPGASPSALARQSDVIDLFITGNDGRVYTSFWTPSGGWSGVNNNWQPIGGFFPTPALDTHP